MKRPTWGRFAPPSQVPPFSFSLSFSFQFPFNLNYETKRLKTDSQSPATTEKQRTKKNRKKQSVSQTIFLVMTIQMVQESSKLELSSRFLSRFKFRQNLDQKDEKNSHATFWRIQPNVPGFISKPFTKRTFPGTFVKILRKVAGTIFGKTNSEICFYDDMLIWWYDDMRNTSETRLNTRTNHTPLFGESSRSSRDLYRNPIQIELSPGRL